MVLKQKSAKKSETIRIRIPASLAQQIEELTKAAAEKNLVFDTSEICNTALSVAIKQARIELSKG